MISKWSASPSLSCPLDLFPLNFVPLNLPNTPFPGMIIDGLTENCVLIERIFTFGQAAFQPFIATWANHIRVSPKL